MDKVRSLIGRMLPLLGFKSSKGYWETRYRMGGTSGEGSRGPNAEYKAKVINKFIAEHGVDSLIEFGCGDGYQLGMFDAKSYVGVDVSSTIVEHCRNLYASDAGKSFIQLDDYRGQQADLSLSLDVIFHLVEDSVYHDYLDRLFSASTRFVIIYSTSVDMPSTGTPHVRHRDCVADVAKRYPGFTRLNAFEAALPPPVRFDRGHPTKFFVYERA